MLAALPCFCARVWFAHLGMAFHEDKRIPEVGIAESDYETFPPIPHGFSTPATETTTPSSPSNDELGSIKVESFQGSKHSPQENATPWQLDKLIEYILTLAHLATFGILGVFVRYGLEHLFGPSIAQVTSSDSPLFIDLPANMLGCFFMGWTGIVLKTHIMQFSEHLSLGLSTGLMGSITTFASWSQSSVKVITRGYWTRGICGFLLGMELSMMSLHIGVDTANMFLSFIQRKINVEKHSLSRKWNLSVCIVLCLWVMVLLMTQESSHTRKILGVACMSAPLGVWMRWWLSSLNTKGLRGRLIWLPVGTLCANVVAAGIEFILSTLQLSIRNQHFVVVSKGLQLGLLGCMSTVSTLVVEVYFLHQGTSKWRSYAYPCATILVTFVIGLLSFSTVVWIRGDGLRLQ